MAAIEMNKEQFTQAIQGDKPVLVEFFAPWCVYCKRIGPAYEKVAEAYGDTMTVAKVSIDDEKQLAKDEGVKSIPTLILYKDGQAVDTIVVPKSKAEIDQFIAQALDN